MQFQCNMYFKEDQGRALPRLCSDRLGHLTDTDAMGSASQTLASSTAQVLHLMFLRAWAVQVILLALHAVLYVNSLGFSICLLLIEL